MTTITIEIPQKILERGGSSRRLVVVDPKEFEKEIQQRWEEKDALDAVRVMELEKRQGKLRVLKSLKDLMKSLSGQSGRLCFPHALKKNLIVSREKFRSWRIRSNGNFVLMRLIRRWRRTN